MTADNLTEQFIFNSDNLVVFCSKYGNANQEDQSDTLLEVKLQELDKKWYKFEMCYENVIIAPETDISAKFKESARSKFGTCSDAYMLCRSQLLDMLKVIRSNAAPLENITSDTDNVATSSGAFLKLPPCDTEIFSGGFEEWPSFRDIFTAVYVNHPKLSDVEKLFHLRNKTRGDAGAIVKRFPLCNENFALAWEALEEQYENISVLVDNQVNILLDIQETL